MASPRHLVLDQDPLYRLGDGVSAALDARGHPPRVPSGQAAWLLMLSGSARLERGSILHRLEPGGVIMLSTDTVLHWARRQEVGAAVYLQINVSGFQSLRYFNSIQFNFGHVHSLPLSSEPVRAARRLAAWAEGNPRRDEIDESQLVFRWLWEFHRFLDEHRPRFRDILELPAREMSALSLPLVRRSLADYSERLGVSRSVLTRHLKERWGEAPGVVLRRTRLAYAARMLRSGTLSIEEIAHEVGLGASRTLIHAFKREFGVTPGEYRRSPDTVPEVPLAPLRPPKRARSRPALPPAVLNPQVATKPRVADWDGHFYRLFQAGLLHAPETHPHDNILNAMEYLGCWMLTLSGQAVFEAGDRRVEMTAGTAVVLPQPSHSRWYSPPSAREWKRLSLYFTWEIAMGYFNHLLERYGHAHRVPLDSRPVRLARELASLVKRRKQPDVFVYSLKTFEFLTEWHRLLRDQAAAAGPAHAPVRLPALESRLVSFQPRTIRNWAAAIGYSRSYLSKRLREQWDQTPARVLRRVRLEEAARLLRVSNLKVQAVAERLGYPSSASFCITFKRTFRQTPLAYRHDHRRNPAVTMHGAPGGHA